MQLDHCVIAVSDWDRSNRFYANVRSTPHPRAAAPVRPGNSDLCFRWPELISYGR